MEQGLIAIVVKALLGLPPEQVRWAHVGLVFVLSSMVWGPPIARVYWHIRRERFLLRATPEQLTAYLKDPPKPPSLGGPAAMVLGFALAGALLGRGGASPVEARLGATQSPPMTQTQSYQDPAELACYPPGEGPKTTATDEDSESERTCCKGRCEPGSQCNPKTCKCDANAATPRGAVHFVTVGADPILEAGSAYAPDWEPGE